LQEEKQDVKKENKEGYIEKKIRREKRLARKK